MEDPIFVSKNNKIFSANNKEWNYQLDEIDSDIIGDICQSNLLSWIGEQYDLVINQALLEHIYDPYGAMKTMSGFLKKGGYLITHTHSIGMFYHPFPADYMRFMIDWWYDLPNHITDIKLIEYYEDGISRHVFSCYEKL